MPYKRSQLLCISIPRFWRVSRETGLFQHGIYQEYRERPLIRSANSTPTQRAHTSSSTNPTPVTNPRALTFPSDTSSRFAFQTYYTIEKCFVFLGDRFETLLTKLINRNRFS